MAGAHPERGYSDGEYQCAGYVLLCPEHKEAYGSAPTYELAEALRAFMKQQMQFICDFDIVPVWEMDPAFARKLQEQLGKATPASPPGVPPISMN